MNIQQFQYVVAVVDLKNFEAAADRCCITQSTLSTMVGRLENEIGIKIFNRKTKPVSIYPEGVPVIQCFRIILREIEHLQMVVQEMKGEMIGELKIGIIPTIAPTLLPLFLKEYALKFPKMGIKVREMNTSEIQHSLNTRELDVGILALPLEDKTLQEIELYTEPFLLYDATGKQNQTKVDIDHLDYSNLWLLQEGHCLRNQVLRMCERSKMSGENKKNIEFESGSIDSLMRFTRGNKGITIIPYLTSLDLIEEDKTRLTSFVEPIPHRLVGVVIHSNFIKKKLLKELIITIQKRVHPLLPKQEDIWIVNPFQ